MLWRESDETKRTHYHQWCEDNACALDWGIGFKHGLSTRGYGGKMALKRETYVYHTYSQREALH
jgi:hypothetical protein